MPDFGDWSQEVFTILNDDATLAITLTGGVYLFRDLPEAFSRLDLPAAYDPSTNFLRPIAIVKGADAVPLFAARSQDSSNRHTVVNQTMQIWIYDAVHTGWDNISIAASRIYVLLEQVKLTQSWNTEFSGQINSRREPDLRDASFILQEYLVTGRL